MKYFDLKIYTADSVVADEEAGFVAVPAYDGEYGVLAGHEHAVVAIKSGLMKYRLKDDPEDSMRRVFVSDGIMRIDDDGVMVLVEKAQAPEEVESNAAKEKEEEERNMKDMQKSAMEFRNIEVKLKRDIQGMKG
ncbi:MAG: F0F1 ATP synthase subunit epsilon [Lachnospiraceae bacterium]|nr:F0F1 ATP synthase subunit epsilon [Lachnospiraceae bacterium]